MQLIYHAAIEQYSSPPCSLSRLQQALPCCCASVQAPTREPRAPLALIAWNLAARRGCHSPWPASTFITCSCAVQAWTQCGKPIWLGKAKFLSLFPKAPSQPTLPRPLAPGPHAPSAPSIALGRSARKCIFCWGWGSWEKWNQDFLKSFFLLSCMKIKPLLAVAWCIMFIFKFSSMTAS